MESIVSIKKIIFVAFAIEDETQRNFLKGQSLLTNSPFEYIDMSVTEAYESNWKDKVRTRIFRSHGVIVLVIVNQRAKLTRVLGGTALKSFHSGLLNNRHLVGELWSVTNGYYCGSKKTAFCQ